MRNAEGDGNTQQQRGDAECDLQQRGREHEPRGALHRHFENPSKDRAARVLILFLIKDGRAGYTRERP